jgi:chemotaxis protein histidine kinase CheA
MDVLPVIEQLRSAILDQPGFSQLNQHPPTMSISADRAESPGPPAVKKTEESSIRVHTHKLDGLLDLIGELVVNQSMMISHRVNGTTASDHAVQTLSYIEKIVLELQ